MSAYLIAAYMTFWGCTFALVLSIWARQRGVERDIERLQKRLQDR